MSVSVNIVGTVCKDHFHQAQVRDFGNIDALCASTRPHRPHSAQIERQADELELGFRLFQTPHAELAKPQNVLDPAVGRLGYPLAFAVVTLGLVRSRI